MLLKRTKFIDSKTSLRSQTLANIIVMFENIYHLEFHLTQRHREFFLYTLHSPCFSAEAYSEGYSESLERSNMDCFFIQFSILSR